MPQKNIKKIVQKYQRNMQKIIEKDKGLTKITLQIEGMPPVTIAEKKPRKEPK